VSLDFPPESVAPVHDANCLSRTISRFPYHLGGVPTVAIDATPLLGAPTGIGVAVRGLLAELAGRPELDLVGYGFTGTGWARLRSKLPARVRLSRAPMPASALLRAWARTDRPAGDWWMGSVDVIHGTNFVVPPSRCAARLVSVWDLTAVRYPELCTPTSRRYPALVRRAIDRGAWVHTGAASVAAEIVDHFGVDPGRVRVIPPGVEPAYASVQPTKGGSPPYLLGLGTSEPRKDFPGLVAAFDELAATHSSLELRIAGPPGWGEAQLQEAISGARHRDRVRRLGWVENIGPLLAGAAVFVYPSRYEGFGLPPLEAMACGVPVVATTAGSLPEVLGDAALLVPVGEPPALAAAIGRVLSDDSVRSGLIRAGRRRVEDFSWRSAGDALIGTYLEMVAAR
jgi:glycosyltransferase involved in cell wall biosynthesis